MLSRGRHRELDPLLEVRKVRQSGFHPRTSQGLAPNKIRRRPAVPLLGLHYVAAGSIRPRPVAARHARQQLARVSAPWPARQVQASVPRWIGSHGERLDRLLLGLAVERRRDARSSGPWDAAMALLVVRDHQGRTPCPT